MTGAGSPGVAAPRASGGAGEDATESTDGEDTGDGSRFASPRSIARLLGCDSLSWAGPPATSTFLFFVFSSGLFFFFLFFCPASGGRSYSIAVFHLDSIQGRIFYTGPVSQLWHGLFILGPIPSYAIRGARRDSLKTKRGTRGQPQNQKGHKQGKNPKPKGGQAASQQPSGSAKSLGQNARIGLRLLQHARQSNLRGCEFTPQPPPAALPAREGLSLQG